MKKFAIKSVAAAVSALSAIAAQAAVDIDAGTITPAVFAKEIVASTGTPTTLTNNANLLDIQVKQGYALSNGEVRYVRAELANGVFKTATVTSGNANTAIGAVNGVGTSVIYFSITAGTGGAPATDVLTIAGDREITGTASNMTVSYSLYDQPSQAQAGGTTGRIVNKADKAYVNFAQSYQVAVTTDSYVANVEASPAFSAFLNNPANTSNSTTLARLAALDYKLATTVPYKADGTAIALTDLMAVGSTGTKLVVTGDFGNAANSNGSFTGSALNRVYLSNAATCAAVTVPAVAVNSTTATFEVGATATTPNSHLCYAPRNAGATNGAAIPAAVYTADLNAVSADTNAYAVSNIAKGQVGVITRNGTELQAPLVQTTAGYVSRFYLTNTGSLSATWTAKVQSEDGNTPVTGVLTGEIPAGKSLEVPVSSVVTGWTEGKAPRGTVIFTVARPNSQIQGVYQLVNQATGAATIVPMLRPGTN